MKYIWIAIKVLCFPLVVLDRTMDNMIDWEKALDEMARIHRELLKGSK